MLSKCNPQSPTYQSKSRKKGLMRSIEVKLNQTEQNRWFGGWWMERQGWSSGS
jgi:hypothetical protein